MSINIEDIIHRVSIYHPYDGNEMKVISYDNTEQSFYCKEVDSDEEYYIKYSEVDLERDHFFELVPIITKNLTDE